LLPAHWHSGCQFDDLGVENGQRHSSEAAMLAMSTLLRMSQGR
jgi:hypothetical protein